MTNDVDTEQYEIELYEPDDKTSKVRMYLLTINNYNDEEIEIIEKYMNCIKTMKYAVIGWEIAPTTSTPHVHVYLHWVSSKSFTQMKKKFPRADIRRCRGTPQQVSKYCKKDGTYKEVGDVPTSGKRTDIEHIRDVLREDCCMADVVQCARSSQAVAVAQMWIQYHEPPRNWKTHVKWYYGESGSGKTYAALEELGEDYYECPSNGKWFQGYDAHENCLIDDIRDTFMEFGMFLKFIYKNRFRIECKGSSRQWKPKLLIITCPVHPEELWNNNEDKYQLLRRIDEIRHFNGRYLGEDEIKSKTDTDII